ncbi:dihydroorotate dehydrogenase [Silvibacterium dinghuense]|uniref:Dihydroorotate dehydrogenase n=1 Tax=Silvibacterium dinghuense TaxID=1560006 RepID=A0A4Q1SKV7_9BACT|nr:dihydroorotate dehydrogenase [Silvibacterium dinghuense]RXS98105.1 dihydroorotate dehydrogenase [Silvibacterium dinghuense]
MRIQFAGIELANPVLAASGTFGYGVEFEEIVNLEKIGGFVTKGISREPMAGNAAPRIIETASGMMNAIGLQNVGVDAYLEQKLPPMRNYPRCAVIVNVFGGTARDYVEVIQKLNDAEGIAAYEINASCPNTDHGGMVFGTDPGALSDLVWRVKQVAKRPILIKLSPNVTSISQMARCAEESGADAVSLVNTFVSLAIDIDTRRPRIANVTAGLSGPAIKPIALRMVWEAAKSVKIPVIGLGGIVSAEDAVEFLIAGATAVQVGTATYADPRASERIAHGLEHWCTRHHIEKVTDLIGTLDTSKK